MVAVGSDLGEQLSHTGLCPVSAYHWQDVPQHVRLGDRAINVRNHHLTEFGSKPVQLHVMQVTQHIIRFVKVGPCLCASKGRCGICTLLCPENQMSVGFDNVYRPTDSQADKVLSKCYKPEMLL